MAQEKIDSEAEPTQEKDEARVPELTTAPAAHGRWTAWFRKKDQARSQKAKHGSPTSSGEEDDIYKSQPEKWSLGILNDRITEEVPGTVLLMPNSKRNEPLGLQNAPARISASSLPSPFPPASRSASRVPSRPTSARPSILRRVSEKSVEEKKRTPDGKIILDPQPEDSLNDPLNWPQWRRDVALLSLGFYCMLGGGMTPVLAAGFQNVADTYKVTVPRVALTTGLYMMGLGLGSVIASPTAIIYGKRPVYLMGIVLFILSAVWCALSPSYISLVIARIFMGLAVSPCECLPSATIAEIFYLHERAYRLGIYTLLLLGGKNIVPLVSAVIIQGLGWRWVFWLVAMIVGFCLVLMFFFVPETFWDRTPRPKHRTSHALRSISTFFHHPLEKRSSHEVSADGPADMRKFALSNSASALDPSKGTIAGRRKQKNEHHVGFADPDDLEIEEETASNAKGKGPSTEADQESQPLDTIETAADSVQTPSAATAEHTKDASVPAIEGPPTPGPRSFDSPYYTEAEKSGADYFQHGHHGSSDDARRHSTTSSHRSHIAYALSYAKSPTPSSPGTHAQRYTSALRDQPPKSYRQTLKPWNGRLRHEKWFYVALRPFILFAYPSILWSTLVYSLSIGWLIVLSESVSTIFRNKETYNFTALQTGLVYLSPFIGGILGTAVAGKVSDIIVRFMSRRNGGVYEPEFRLVMAIPVTACTCIGLMGFGWSAQERDLWIVPTVFFGIISFGCSLGSTTAITFAVDSYRQYAGEALVTLNFSKNIFHGLVFSLFFNTWLDADGSKSTFLAIGGIQLACLLTTIPMYIYGKRARMWTVRRNLMEKL